MVGGIAVLRGGLSRVMRGSETVIGEVRKEVCTARGLTGLQLIYSGERCDSQLSDY
jgi:hypothetical protein